MTPDAPMLDCRGLLCPKPLLEAKRAVADLTEGAVTVLVDNLAAKENVSRAMATAGHEVLAEEVGGEWRLTITIGASCEVLEQTAPGKTVVLVSDRGFGRSDPDLGAILMKAFMATISELALPPAELLLMQAGVRLACEGSPCLAPLRALEEAGVTVLACGTCLDYFGLMDKLEVGRISNMADIVDSLMAADRTIPL